MPQGQATVCYVEHRWLTSQAARNVCRAQCSVKSRITLGHHKEDHVKKGPRARVIASVGVGIASASLQDKLVLCLRLKSCEAA